MDIFQLTTSLFLSFNSSNLLAANKNKIQKEINMLFPKKFVSIMTIVNTCNAHF